MKRKIQYRDMPVELIALSHNAFEFYEPDDIPYALDITSKEFSLCGGHALCLRKDHVINRDRCCSKCGATELYLVCNNLIKLKSVYNGM